MSLAYAIAWKRAQIRKAEIMRDLHDETGNPAAADRADNKIVRYLEELLDLELIQERRGPE